MTIDTFNTFMVSSQAGKVVILNLPSGAMLSDEEVLNLAAWLLAVSGRPMEEFIKVYEGVCNA